jgi:GNAT superfamily N-acetyltransferase
LSLDAGSARGSRAGHCRAAARHQTRWGATKNSGVEALELWCFQANSRACRFYEARGFRAIRFTDGADNEEKTPDVRYRWERAA